MSMPVIAACAAYVMHGDRRVNKGAFHGTELPIRNKMACTDTVWMTLQSEGMLALYPKRLVLAQRHCMQANTPVFNCDETREEAECSSRL